MTRLSEWLHRTTVVQAALGVAWVLACAAIGLAGALIIAPDQMMSVPTFRHALEFAPPHVWGIGWGVLGTWVGVRLLLEPPTQLVAPPLYALGLYSSVWSIFTLPGIIAGTGAPSAVVAYMALGVISAICGYALEKGDR